MQRGLYNLVKFIRTTKLTSRKRDTGCFIESLSWVRARHNICSGSNFISPLLRPGSFRILPRILGFYIIFDMIYGPNEVYLHSMVCFPVLEPTYLVE